ncbi:hypothetical protein K470DRAFT_254373 [Piedraia hortae CBS 480.64]|uniref:GRIP domain-containing protein n=1 Tax=Piedraia hortae CBS 480.64 TaxID=1314780 RepID=A0A6A7C9W0_9PEZI|nr:hypothetical protein K470DRAFT_254373 [Piedraia hortae CBS 480.64]
MSATVGTGSAKKKKKNKKANGNEEAAPAEAQAAVEANGSQPDGAKPSVTEDAAGVVEEAKEAQDMKEGGGAKDGNPNDKDATARLDALQQERNELRDEVTKLRQSLEDLRRQHGEELAQSQGMLERLQQGKKQAETQYRNLLGKVNVIRSQLDERLKADAEELEQARGRIEELEAAQATAAEENERLQEQVSALNDKVGSQSAELEALRKKSHVSTSNWVRERDDMAAQLAHAREEGEVARQAMQDWEMLATEERSRREAAEESRADVEEQLSALRETHARARHEAETQSSTISGLQRALKELQDERKRELKEIVEQSEAQVAELRKQAVHSDEAAASLRTELDQTKAALERAEPFEREVKEKTLQIGKLRHEAVTLNDHLTKALRFLKRGKLEDNVDRQLVTNHFLQFLALDRGDPKKFQVLQLIAALLGWDERQKEQAGLVRAGSNSGPLKVPLSPFRRTPSTPTLGSEFFPDSPVAGKESMAELWNDFLEREAAASGGN